MWLCPAVQTEFAVILCVTFVLLYCTLLCLRAQLLLRDALQGDHLARYTARSSRSPQAITLTNGAGSHFPNRRKHRLHL
ncbi:hypothetical protein Q7C36_005017 [Tachysurus vachellii]|uniref:Uncharacterized protein n=1 Tax=Tachysurus vachellii TaxID=175792 RepID=A0AA88T3B3_TACVA|nr:hypothetical protein Q7C36_005017 [Tachysurus vachellii]